MAGAAHGGAAAVGLPRLRLGGPWGGYGYAYGGYGRDRGGLGGMARSFFGGY